MPKLFSSEKSWGLVNSRLNSLKSQCISPNFASLTTNDTHCKEKRRLRNGRTIKERFDVTMEGKAYTKVYCLDFPLS